MDCLLLSHITNLNGLGNKTREPSISVTDKKNNFIGSIGDVYGGLLDANNIPENLLKAVVVLEDKKIFLNINGSRLYWLI